MSRNIDGKFFIDGEQIVSRHGNVVPEDEPLFLLRARDENAILTLKAYRDICHVRACPWEHVVGIEDTIRLFERFRRENPERMKEPGSSLRGKPTAGGQP
jgi:hypothetical protein